MLSCVAFPGMAGRGIRLPTMLLPLPAALSLGAWELWRPLAWITVPALAVGPGS